VWFKELVGEIQSQAKVKLTNKALIDEMLKFKNRAPTELTDAYPSNDAISRRWPAAKTKMPYKPSHDFLLSFMSEKYPQVKAEVIEKIENKLAEHLDKHSRTVLDKHIHNEYYRRQGDLKYPYWSAVRKRMRDKYCDLYLLIRKNGNRNITFEICRLSLNDSNFGKCLLKMEWLSEGELWHADMYISPFKFTGTAVRQSGNHLPEPVNFSILRNSSVKNGQKEPVSLMLAGQISGWKTGLDQVLVNSEIYLWRLPQSFHTEETSCDLLTISNDPKIKPLLGQPVFETKANEILKDMFEDRWFTVSKTDGTGALMKLLSEIFEESDLPF